MVSKFPNDYEFKGSIPAAARTPTILKWPKRVGFNFAILQFGDTASVFEQNMP